jgi:hypothetical protein
MREEMGGATLYSKGLKGRDKLENPGIDVRIILKCISSNNVWIRTGFSWLRITPSGRFLCSPFHEKKKID